MEITDEKIFKIALITAIIGIMGMIIFGGSIEPKEVSIKEINKGMIGEKIAIKGVIESIKPSSKGNSYFILLNDGTGKINIIIFENMLLELQKSEIDINSYKGKKARIFGSVTEYNSAMELTLDNSNSIKIIK
jgi:DNA/RNA endonuclease YhcR with UshA esterase domain